MFVGWKHGEETLKLCVEYLNPQHPNIKFTMALEENDQLAVLDVLVMRQQGQTESQTSSDSEASDDASNAIAKRHVRIPRAAEAEQAAEEAEHHDQEGAESAPEPAEDLSNVEDVDDQDRDKRYTADHGHAGSGNFLFDIIRVSGA
nr:unnamed protein product [Callosobruchus analis]